MDAQKERNTSVALAISGGSLALVTLVVGNIGTDLRALMFLAPLGVFVGVLGLMQRLNLTETVPAPEFRKAQPGDPILVFNLQDLETRFERISATPDVRVAEAPRRIEYPGPGGSVIPVLFSAVWDADGNFIELNRILGAPAGR